VSDRPVAMTDLLVEVSGDAVTVVGQVVHSNPAPPRGSGHTPGLGQADVERGSPPTS
jgi:hypothetical protein